MKKRKIIISIIFIVCVVCNCVFSYGFNLNDINPIEPNNAATVKVNSVTSNVLGIIQTIGVILSVLILILIGIKYMLGSVEEKAEYKKTLMPYIIGAFLLFTGTLVPNVIYKIVKGV